MQRQDNLKFNAIRSRIKGIADEVEIALEVENLTL
ncbi:MAG: hypothetical protein ACI8YQ_004784 [Polaribacter sp.]|jgi:hypothetical protein